MQTANFESSFPITGKMMWDRNYDAISRRRCASSTSCVGELAWVGVRLLDGGDARSPRCIAAFGVARTPLMLAAIPAAVLTGLAFSAPIMAYAATLEEAGQLQRFFRFVITPLFLFSGVFFPISRLPGPLQTAGQRSRRCFTGSS